MLSHPKSDEANQRVQALRYALSDEFNGSLNLVQQWLNAPHPDFGGKSPSYYIEQGKIEVVENLVHSIASGQAG